MRALRRLLHPAAALLVLGPAPAAPSTDLREIRASDPAQTAYEARVMRVYADPAVQRAKERARQLFLTDPSAQTRDGRVTLDAALEELVLAAVSGIVLDDPGTPALPWGTLPAHAWFGVEMPGARWGADNPDNVYRSAAIDENSRYVIAGRIRGSLPADATLTLGGVAATPPDDLPEDTYEAGWAATIALLRLNDVETDADGAFTISIDRGPADGRANHLQSQPGTTGLLVRHTLTDWATQTPPELRIERVAGPPQTRATDEDLAGRVAARLEKFVPFVLAFKERAFDGTPANTFSSPKPTPGGLANQVSSFGSFNLADDQALVVTVDPAGARYLGFQLTDPWMVSSEYIAQTGSLNHAQAVASADGTYTYVIAARDPGIHNWLDPGGLSGGYMLIRWQQLPGEPRPLPDSAVRVRLVSHAELDGALPPETTRVSPEARREQLRVRAASFARRIAEH